MEAANDISAAGDIKILVNTFYEKVSKDGLPAPVFNERIGDQWTQQLEKMYSFWRTVLLAENTYRGSPFLPHTQLRVEHTHFMRWLELFNEPVDGSFQGEKASEAAWRTAKMASMFESKVEYHRSRGFRNIL